MNVLILNCGSSSLKFMLIETDNDRIASDSDRVLAKGVFERLGSQSLITLSGWPGQSVKLAMPLRDHKAAIEYLCRWLISEESGLKEIRSYADIHAVGHRVVHGGENFKQSIRIDSAVIKGIEDCIELAPLHNPANLDGIHAASAILGEAVPQVAVFDTAFHSTMPEAAFLYAIPYQLYRRYKIRRYGFHGTSHRYVAYRFGKLTGTSKGETSIVTLHLGNGCSACAIQGGKSVDTSMGMTPLEGLVMGTRSGDIDPAIIEFLAHREGLSVDQIDMLLNKESGLLGLSGLTNDMRDLLAEEAEHKDRRASLAIEIFCRRIKKYIGAYLAALGGAKAIVFTGGIGENSPEIRRRILDGQEWLGIDLDEKSNREAIGTEVLISTKTSRIAVYVIPTNEELLIARDTVRAV